MFFSFRESGVFTVENHGIFVNNETRLIKDDNMNKSFLLAAVVLSCSFSAFAQPSFFPPEQKMKATPVPKENNLDINFSGRWIGRCDGDTKVTQFTIQQTAYALNMIFDNETIKFLLNGVSDSQRLSSNVLSQDHYVADWDSENQNLKLKMVRMGHASGNFELTLSQLTLHLVNNQLFIQNTHHALFNGVEEFQTGKSDCLYERN